MDKLYQTVFFAFNELGNIETEKYKKKKKNIFKINFFILHDV